jgi:hypothetical protein
MAGKTDDLKPREPIAIDPARVTLSNNGFGWRDFMVRLPKDFVADDLKEPSIWRKVQLGANALRRHDHLYLVSHDENWVAEAIVADAERNHAVLCKPRITNFPERYDRFFEDENYRVKWMGQGYVVERKRDGHVMCQPLGSAALAERELQRLYPVKV